MLKIVAVGMKWSKFEKKLISIEINIMLRGILSLNSLICVCVSIKAGPSVVISLCRQNTAHACAVKTQHMRVPSKHNTCVCRQNTAHACAVKTQHMRVPSKHSTCVCRQNTTHACAVKTQHMRVIIKLTL
jgi:hypothetical protein